jgi:hypothetical protein
MKLGSRKEPLTFGAFVAGGYRAWGDRRAKGIIHLAVKAHVIEFCGQQRFMIY